MTRQHEVEIQTFLDKRGYKSNVRELKKNSYVVELYSKSVQDVANLLANISEGSRIIVALHHPDFFKLIEDYMEDKHNLIINEMDSIARGLEDRIKAIEDKKWYKPWDKGEKGK